MLRKVFADFDLEADLFVQAHERGELHGFTLDEEKRPLLPSSAFNLLNLFDT